VTQTLHDYAAEQADAIAAEYGAPPDGRDQLIERWTRGLVSGGGVPDDILEAMPEVSRSNSPQCSPQEYECGCVAVTRVTDRGCVKKPFEMRLAIPCEGLKECEAWRHETAFKPWQRQTAPGTYGLCPHCKIPTVTLYGDRAGYCYACGKAHEQLVARLKEQAKASRGAP
jgi:hypothetical protein